MKWSFKLARIYGIDVRIHWTFAILLLWLAMGNLLGGQGVVAAAKSITFVLAIFLCVVLHEFGHALVARRFGVKTVDITLLPIGGVARMERMPQEPRQELLIAIAGPLVNVAIAVVLFLAILLANGLESLAGLELKGGNVLALMLLVNIAIVVFNMIPAFPMDGGRVLRALLAQNMDYVRATEMAANIGQIFAIVFGIFGLFYNWFLIFIALFVYLGAHAESRSVLTRAMLEGVRVREAMMTRFVSVSPDQSLRDVVEELLAGAQQDFPVVDDSGVAGILRRRELIEAIAEGKLDEPVRSAMSCEYHPVDDDDLLRDTLETMQHSTCETLPVFRAKRLVGLLTQTNIAEWLMVQSALRGAVHSREGSI